MHYRFQTLSIRRLLFLLIVFCIPFFSPATIYAQGKKSANTKADSLAQARKEAAAERMRVLDSARTAHQQKIDSINTARQHRMDSIKVARKKITDSLTAIRKYRESKHYKDSITKARNARRDSIRAVQKAHFDSLRAERKRISDSATAVRKAFLDSLHTVQKNRADSLSAIRKYHESKRYKDSVAIVRQGRIDSMRAERKHIADSASASRRQIAEKLAADRKHTRDSLTAIRTKFMDSIKAVRKVRADSLAKIREKKENDRKILEKDKERLSQLKFELQIKKKHEAWSNEKMLKKKWSLPRKVIQNTFTRYNYYFNADRRMDQALVNMQRLRRENYDSLLSLFPFDPNKDSTALAPDMDSIIQKASVGIQIHDPRTKWGDDLYLLLGQAYFYKGKYDDAALSFRYIVSLKQLLDKEKEKKNGAKDKKADIGSIAEAEDKSVLDFIKHQSVHNEALLWLTRTYTQADKLDAAESVIELLASDPNFPADLQGRLALERAFFDLKDNNYQAVIAQLAIVSDDERLPEWIRLRASFINGQLLQREEKYAEAAESFRKVINMNPKIDMDFYARKNLAYSLMYAGGNQQDAIASLKHMLNDGKYSSYYEQIYYVLGRLSANNNSTTDAIAYLQKGIDAPKSTKRQKAVSFAALGNIYYDQGKFTRAKMAYDSAAYLGSHAADDNDVKTAVRRSKSLDEAVTALNTISTQDSLLSLAELSEREQKQTVRKYIRTLEQKRADSIYRAENPTLAAQGESSGGDNNAYSNWYFSNPVLMQQGLNDFKRKWGNRPLADNWRRSAALGFAPQNNPGNNTNTSTSEETTDGTEEFDENGFPTEASLLAKIPTTAAQKEQASLRIQRAYVDLANAYIRQLDDYARAIRTMDTLDKLYPNHVHKAELLYMRYLVALNQNKLPEAQQYSAQLVQQYPDSHFAAMVRPTEDAPQPANGVDVPAFYEATYNLLMQHQYTDVVQRSKKALTEYKDPRYKSRFIIAEASALAGIPDYETADTVITNFIQSNPGDTLISRAHVIREYILQHKPKTIVQTTDTKPGADLKGEQTVGDIKNDKQADDKELKKSEPTKDDAGAMQEDVVPSANTNVPVTIPASYSYQPNEEHYFLFVFPKMETKVMGVKAALNDFNNIQYSILGLNTNIELMKNQKGFVAAQKFNNAIQAKAYMSDVKAKQQIFREYQANEYQLCIISASNYRKLVADKDFEPYLKFYKSKYK